MPRPSAASARSGTPSRAAARSAASPSARRHANPTGTAPQARRSARVASRAERGHFRYESGHHGDLWLDLDGLLADAGRARG
jgi:hypothetical protein